MPAVSTTAALLRRMRVERGTLLLLFVLVAVTSFVVAAGPRLFDRSADAGLRYEIAGATAIQRNLEFAMAGQVPAQVGNPFARVRARGDELWSRLPASAQAIIAGRGFMVETPRFLLADPPNFTTLLTLAYQDGAEAHVSFVDGRAPARAEPPADPSAPLRLEVALSTSTAETTKIAVGDRLRATVDGGDPLLRRIFPRLTTAIEVDVVGLFEVDDPGDPFWFDDTRLAEASIGGTEEFPIAHATALFAPSAYQDVRALDLPGLYHWRFLSDTSRIDAARLETLVPDLRRLETMFGSTTGTPGDLVYRSGLLGLVDRFRSLRAVTQATLSIAALGPLAVAAGAVGMVALIVVRRRRTALLLARGRGASSGQLLGAQGWEGLIVTVPAALVGLVAASVAVPARPSAASSAGVLAVALVATALTVAATWPFARRARRDVEREDAPSDRPTARRLVLEATIIGVAVAATWLLRERSLTAAATSNEEPGFDPFLAAAPVLIGIAAALAAIRLYPIPVRALAALAARRRDLVPVLGLRSIGRHPSAAYLPLLVLTLTVAIGVFSSVVQTTIERGQLDASWQEVGADYRIDVPVGDALADDLDLAGIEGITAVAQALSLSVEPAGDPGGSWIPTQLHAVDPTAYAAVVAGTPADVALPPDVMAAPTRPRIGTPEDPIPALASTRLSKAGPGWSLGDVFGLKVGGRPLYFRIVAFAASFPGLAPNASFIVAPLPSVAAGQGGSALRPNRAFARGQASAGPGLEAAIASTITAERLVSRHARFAAFHDAPLVGAVGAGFGIALAVAAAYAALTVVAVIALDAQRRSRELAYLRTLGLTDRQLVGLTVVEHGPPVVLALAVGVGLGLAVAWLLAPGLELAVFIDPRAPVVLRIDSVSVAAVMTAIVLVVAVAVGASSWLARRLDAAEALRMGEA